MKVEIAVTLRFGLKTTNPALACRLANTSPAPTQNRWGDRLNESRAFK